MASFMEIDSLLARISSAELDELRRALCIGIQQVTLTGSSHLVTQVYCSALPVAYTSLPHALWERFGRLVLEAAYEATFAAAVINAKRTGNKAVFLTLLGEAHLETMSHGSLTLSSDPQRFARTWSLM